MTCFCMLIKRNFQETERNDFILVFTCCIKRAWKTLDSCHSQLLSKFFFQVQFVCEKLVHELNFFRQCFVQLSFPSKPLQLGRVEFSTLNFLNESIIWVLSVHSEKTLVYSNDQVQIWKNANFRHSICVHISIAFSFPSQSSQHGFKCYCV